MKDYKISPHWDNWETPLGNRKQIPPQPPEAVEKYAEEILSKIKVVDDPIMEEKREYFFLEELKGLVFDQLPKGWIYDKITISFLRTLCAYFSKHESFFRSSLLVNPESASLEKGLCIIGNSGLGKSFTMKLFAQVLTGMANGFKFVEVADIISNWETGEKDYNKICTNGPDSPLNHMCIDDLGRDVSEKMYKFKFNPIGKLINQREKLWRAWDPREGKKIQVCTHIITNYQGKDLEEFYGSQVLDRIQGISNVISLPVSPSKR